MDLTSQEVLQRFGIALAIGLLVGLEREYSKGGVEHHKAAGVRTYTLMGVLGAASAYLAELTHSAVLAVSFALLAALVVASYLIVARVSDGSHTGITSEVVALLVFVLGALVYRGALVVSVVTAAATMVVLSAKAPLHSFVQRLSTDDWVATLKFVAVTLIVLPILPNQSYGPFAAFNPYRTWLMVVLIGGIGFLGYVLIKTIGASAGIPLAGVIGGMASSTAVALANARRSRTDDSLSVPLALGVILACTVMVPRIAVLVGILRPTLLVPVLVPLTAMLAVSGVFCLILWRRTRAQGLADGHEAVRYANPFELGTALKFAALFAAVTFLVKAVLALGAGAGSLYAVSFLSGLLDVNAITISLAQQVGQGLDPALAAKAIIVGAVANTGLKAGVSGALGSRTFARAVLLGLTLTALTGVAAVFLTR